MRESFQHLILHLILTGIFFLCLGWLCILIQKTIRQYLSQKPAVRTAVILLVTVAALLAQKPGTNGQQRAQRRHAPVSQSALSDAELAAGFAIARICLPQRSQTGV